MTQDHLQPPPHIQSISVMPAPLTTARIFIQIYGWFLMIICYIAGHGLPYSATNL